MADSAGPAGDTVQVSPEHSPRDSSRVKTPVEAPRKTINAARHSVAQRKHSKKRKCSSSKNHRGKNKRPSFLGGTRRLRARLSLPNQVVRARTRTVLTEGRAKTLRHST